VLGESILDDSNHICHQTLLLEKRVAELTSLVEDDSLFPDKYHKKMLDFLQEKHLG